MEIKNLKNRKRFIKELLARDVKFIFSSSRTERSEKSTLLYCFFSKGDGYLLISKDGKGRICYRTLEYAQSSAEVIECRIKTTWRGKVVVKLNEISSLDLILNKMFGYAKENKYQEFAVSDTNKALVVYLKISKDLQIQRQILPSEIEEVKEKINNFKKQNNH